MLTPAPLKATFFPSRRRCSQVQSALSHLPVIANVMQSFCSRHVLSTSGDDLSRSPTFASLAAVPTFSGVSSSYFVRGDPLVLDF